MYKPKNYSKCILKAFVIKYWKKLIDNDLNFFLKFTIKRKNRKQSYSYV